MRSPCLHCIEPAVASKLPQQCWRHQQLESCQLCCPSVHLTIPGPNTTGEGAMSGTDGSPIDGSNVGNSVEPAEILLQLQQVLQAGLRKVLQICTTKIDQLCSSGYLAVKHSDHSPWVRKVAFVSGLTCRATQLSRNLCKAGRRHGQCVRPVAPCIASVSC